MSQICGSLSPLNAPPHSSKRQKSRWEVQMNRCSCVRIFSLVLLCGWALFSLLLFDSTTGIFIYSLCFCIFNFFFVVLFYFWNVEMWRCRSFQCKTTKCAPPHISKKTERRVTTTKLLVLMQNRSMCRQMKWEPCTRTW